MEKIADKLSLYWTIERSLEKKMFGTFGCFFNLVVFDTTQCVFFEKYHSPVDYGQATCSELLMRNNEELSK